MATLVIVRWRTPPPSSINERLIIGDDGRARLEVLRPRPLGTLGRTRVQSRKLRYATDLGGPRGRVDVVAQDPRLGTMTVAADRVGQRLLASPLAVAQFFARSVGGASPARPRWRLGCLAAAPSRRSSSSILPSAQFGSTPARHKCHQLRCRAPDGVHDPTPRPRRRTPARDRGARRLGAISMPVAVPDGADLLSVQVIGSWFLPGAGIPEVFEAHTAPQHSELCQSWITVCH